MKYHTGPCSLFLSRRLHHCNGAHLVSISTYMSSQRERTGVAGGGWKGKDWARRGKGVCWSRGCLNLERRYYCRVIRVFNHLTEPICSLRSTWVQMSRSACAWGGETRITVREKRGGKIQSQKRMWKSVTHVEIREATSEVWFESRAQRAAALISWTQSPVWLRRGGGCLQSENMLFFSANSSAWAAVTGSNRWPELGVGPRWSSGSFSVGSLWTTTTVGGFICAHRAVQLVHCRPTGKGPQPHFQESQDEV